MDRDDDDARRDAALPPIPRETTPYEEGIGDVHRRLRKFVYYISISNSMGMLGGIGVWQLFTGQDEIQAIVGTSAMIFAIGLAAALGTHVVFLGAMAISREADEIARDSGGDETKLSLARDHQTEAFGRLRSGMRILKMSGICFVASTLIGITALVSL